MQLRCIPHLGIDHPVVGEVLHALAGDPMQAVDGLHDGNRVFEGREVALERPRAGAVTEPGTERGCLLRRKSLVLNAVGELDDRLWAQPAV